MFMKSDELVREIEKVQQQIFNLDRIYLVEKTTYILEMEGQVESDTKTWSGFANLDLLLNSK